MSWGNPHLPWRNVPHALILRWNILSNTADKVKQLYIKILWPSPSTPWITCSTVLCVAVTCVVASCCYICYVSLDYIAETLVFLCTTWYLHPQKDALLDCTFHKSCSECKKSVLFSEVCCSLGHHSSEGHYCFQNGGIKVFGRSSHVPPHLNKMGCGIVPLWTTNLSGCHTGHILFELWAWKVCVFLWLYYQVVVVKCFVCYWMPCIDSSSCSNFS